MSRVFAASMLECISELGVNACDYPIAVNIVTDSK